MLYIAHCSMESIRRNPAGKIEGQTSYITSVLEADSPAKAVTKLRRLFTRLKKKDDLLDGALKLYLESLVEVRQIPEAGFVSHYVEGFATEGGFIAAGPRGITEEQYSAYALEPEEEGEEGEEEILPPLLTFEKV